MIRYQTPGLTIFESCLFKTTSSVVATEDFVLVADPTWLPAEIAEIKACVESIRSGRPVHLLFTHSDYDHILGCGAFPGATTIASAAFVSNPGADAQIAQILDFDHEYYIDRPYAIEYPQIQIPVHADGQNLEFRNAALKFFLAPGHNPDGLLTLVEPGGVLIVGDYLSDVEFPFIYHSFAAYRRTLSKAFDLIQSYQVQALISGHGSPCFTQADMLHRVGESFSYLQQLENQVLHNQPFDESALWQRYPYPRSQRKFHLANLKILSEELKRQS
jgi:glyoxylase-like metal-dependent hydrolase (beta-lactamase superfamily II)